MDSRQECQDEIDARRAAALQQRRAVREEFADQQSKELDEIKARRQVTSSALRF